MTAPRYTFRVNPRRYHELYERLESIEEGELSFWIVEALLAKMEMEKGLVTNVTTQPEPIPNLASSLPINPTMVETAVTYETAENSEIESKLDHLARIF
jgi:hypothetical protein